jgi:hypothetical protein
MKKRYVKLNRPEYGGYYIVEMEDIGGIIEAELDGQQQGDDPLTLEIVEMTDTEYKKLPEFMGW